MLFAEMIILAEQHPLADHQGVQLFFGHRMKRLGHGTAGINEKEIHQPLYQKLVDDVVEVTGY